MPEEPRERTYDLTGLSLDEIDCIAGALEYRLVRIESGDWRAEKLVAANRESRHYAAFIANLPRHEDATAALSRHLVERLIDLRGGRPSGRIVP